MFFFKIGGYDRELSRESSDSGYGGGNVNANADHLPSSTGVYMYMYVYHTHASKHTRSKSTVRGRICMFRTPYFNAHEYVECDTLKTVCVSVRI
jgi:hypothetical protein